MATDITTIKNWFKTGLKPTQAQFWATWDSYWHKDESISISSVENLEKLLNNKADNTHEHNQYATNDASSLTDDNVISWQKALKIDDLKFDDQAITTTQDYLDFGLEKGATINSFNNAIYQSVKNKLDTPTEEGTTEDYPFVVGVNEDNESVKLPAGDLGKNFANTDLEVTENRKHIGSNTVEFGMPLVFSNANQQFKNLPDKSSDATYNELVGKDSNGNLSKVGINALTKTMQNASDSEKDAWRKSQLKSDESYSTGQPRIDAVSPPIINKNLDYIQYIALVGINLYVDTKVSVIKMINNETKEETIISEIQSTQSTPNVLSFGINFKNYSLGSYTFQVSNNGIWSQINSVATLTLEEAINDIQLPNFTWSVLSTNNAENVAIVDGNNCTINSKGRGDIIATGAAQTNEVVITKEEMLKGVILNTIVNYDVFFNCWAHYCYFGLTPYNFTNNLITIPKYNARVGQNAVYLLDKLAYSFNCNDSFTDTVLFIIKNNIISIFCKSKGLVKTSVIEHEDYVFKTIAIDPPGSGGGNTKFFTQLISKQYLS